MSAARRSPRLQWFGDPRAHAAGECHGYEPQAGDERRHEHGAKPVFGTPADGTGERLALRTQRVELRDLDETILHGDSEERDEANQRRD